MTLSVTASEVVQTPSAATSITVNPSGFSVGDAIAVCLLSYQPITPAAITPPDSTWSLTQFLPAESGYYAAVLADTVATAADVAAGSFTFEFPSSYDVTAGVVCLNSSVAGDYANLVATATNIFMEASYSLTAVDAVLGFGGNLGSAPGGTVTDGHGHTFTSLQSQGAGTDVNCLLQSVVSYIAHQTGSVYFPAWTTPGKIPPGVLGAMFQEVVGTPLAAVNVAPTSGQYLDASTSVTFQGEYLPSNGQAANAYCLRLKLSGGSYYYWTGSAWSTTQTWVTASIAANSTFSVTIAAAANGPANSHAYQYSFAFQESEGNNKGPFAAADTVFNTSPAPTLTITTPTSGATLINPNPTVAWTDALNGGTSQYSYRVVIYSAAQAAAGGWVPGSSPSLYDSGNVQSAATSITVAGANLATATGDVICVMFTDTHQQASTWAQVTVNVAIGTPVTPVITVATGVDPTSGAPVNNITVQGYDNLLGAQEAAPSSATGIGTWSQAFGGNCTAVGDATGLKLTASSGGAMIAVAGLVGIGLLPVVPLANYTAIASFKADSTGRSCEVGVAYWTAGGTLIGTGPLYGSTVTDTTGGYTQAHYTHTAPSTAAFAAVYVQVLAAGSGESHEVISIGLNPGSTTTWSAGGFAGNTEITVYSTSTYTPLGYPQIPFNSPVANSAPSQTVVIEDLAAVINDTTEYYVVATGSPLGFPVESAPSSIVSNLLPDSIAGTWWLSRTDDPYDYCVPVNMYNDPQLKPKEVGQMYYPLGDPYGTKVTDGYKGRGGILYLRVVGTPALFALRAILEYDGTLMLRSPAADVLFIQHDPATDPIEAPVFNTIGQGANSYHNVQFQFVEVSYP